MGDKAVSHFASQTQQSSQNRHDEMPIETGEVQI